MKPIASHCYPEQKSFINTVRELQERRTSLWTYSHDIKSSMAVSQYRFQSIENRSFPMSTFGIRSSIQYNLFFSEESDPLND